MCCKVKKFREAAGVGVLEGNMGFRCSTWDAMGTNLVLKGMHNVLHFLQYGFPDMDTITISGHDEGALFPMLRLHSPLRKSRQMALESWYSQTHHCDSTPPLMQNYFS